MIRVGLVGVDDPRHRLFLAALDRRRAGVRIVGVSEPDPILREEFARQYDLPAWADHRDLLAEANPSLVAVALAGAGRVVIDALQAAADVLVAPPICQTLEELEKIAELTVSGGRRVTAAHTYRGHPAARTAKELIDDGRLGRPDLVSLIIGPDWDDDRLRTAVGEAIDLFGWLTGADLGAAGTDSGVDDDPEDQAFGELVLAITGTATGTADHPVLEIRRRPDLTDSAGIVQVAGDAGAVEWDLGSGVLRSALGGREPISVACGPFVQPAEWMLTNLLRKPRPVISTEQSLATARLWLAASAQLGATAPRPR